jgi:hypothetical protein
MLYLIYGLPIRPLSSSENHFVAKTLLIVGLVLFAAAAIVAPIGLMDNTPAQETTSVRFDPWLGQIFKVKVVGAESYEWTIEPMKNKDPKVHGVNFVNYKEGRTVSVPFPDDVKGGETLKIDTATLSLTWEGGDPWVRDRVSQDSTGGK